MDARNVVDLKMEELGKKIKTDVIFYDENRPRAKKKVDRAKLNQLTKEIRRTLVYEV